MFNLIFLVVLILVWIVAWFAFIRPKLAAYHATAGVIAQLNAREHSALGWLGLKLQGLKTVLFLFAGSIFTGGFTFLQSLLGLDPTALAPFQDTTIWKTLVGDEMALKVSAAAALAAAILVLHGKLKDIETVPQTPPVIVPPNGTIVPGGK